MDKMRQKHIDEMNRLRTAIHKTKSEYLKKDYVKAYELMFLEEEWISKRNCLIRKNNRLPTPLCKVVLCVVILCLSSQITGF